MPLQKQKIEIPLAAGRDGKMDPKLVPPGKVLEVLNGDLDKTGLIGKRKGYDWLDYKMHSPESNSSAEMVDIFYPQMIRSHKDALLLMASNGPVSGEVRWAGPKFIVRHLEEGTTKKWKHTNAHKHVDFDLNFTIPTSQDIDSVNVCATDNYIVSAWRINNDDKIRFSVYDRNTKSWIVLNDSIRNPFGNNTEVFVFVSTDSGNDWLHFYAVDSSGLRYKDILLNKGTLGGSRAIFVSSGFAFDAANPAFDVISDGSVYYAAWRSTAPDLRVSARNRSGTIILSYNDATIAPDVVGIGLSADKNYVYVCAAVGPAVHIRRLDAATLTLQNSSVRGATGTVTRVAVGGFDSEGAEKVAVYSEHSISPTYDAVVEHDVYSNALVHDVNSIVRHSVLTGKPFTEGTTGGRQIHVPLGHQCDLQPLMVIGHFQRYEVDVGPVNVLDFILDATALRDQSVPLLSGQLAPKNVADLGDGRFLIPLRKLVQSNADGTKTYSPGYIDFKLKPETPPISTALEDEIYFSGGKGTHFDGARLIEVGFALYPENLSTGAISSTGGALGPGVFRALATYEYIDAEGHLHRSAPSTPVSVTVPAGPSTQRFEVTIPYLPYIDLEKSNQTNLVLWRTTSGGSIFYREGIVATNVKTTNNITIWAQTADSVISQNETLYTTGGELSDFPPLPSSYVASSPTRVFSVPKGLPEVIEFSKEIVSSLAPAFNEALRFRVGRGGDNKAIAVLDGNILIFKERSIYAVAGAGPNSLGQGTFSTPRQIASDVGCTDPRSVLEIGTGIYFKSHRGIRFLTRGLEVSPTIGSEVEEYKDSFCIASVLIESKQEARFIHNDGTILIHNYEHNAWMIHTSPTHFTSSIKDAADYNGRMASATENGGTNSIIMAESESLYTDDDTDGTPGVSYGMQVDTPWIKLAGLQGFQRIYWVSLIGEYKTAHTLTISIYYDYVETIVETITVSPSSDPSPYLYRFKPARQKCQAIRFRIVDSAGSGTEENYTLTGLALEIGVKRGLPKLSTAKTL
jgi:hypothetical protein